MYNAPMDLVNTGYASGGATNHGYGYRAARCIFAENAISSVDLIQTCTNVHQVRVDTGCAPGRLSIGCALIFHGLSVSYLSMTSSSNHPFLGSSIC